MWNVLEILRITNTCYQLFHMKMMIGCAGMSVRVLAFTTVGVGPYSPLLGVAEALQDPSAQPSHPSSASDTLTALFLGSLFVFVVFAFVATYYLKRRQTLKKELGHLSGEFCYWLLSSYCETLDITLLLPLFVPFGSRLKLEQKK